MSSSIKVFQKAIKQHVCDNITILKKKWKRQTCQLLVSWGRRDIFLLTDSLIGGQRDGQGVVIGGDGGHFLLVTVNTFLGRRSIRKYFSTGLQLISPLKSKTLPKAQRTWGLSSSYQSNFLRSYHEFLHRACSNFIFRILTKNQLQNLNWTWTFRLNLNFKILPNLASSPLPS